MNDGLIAGLLAFAFLPLIFFVMQKNCRSFFISLPAYHLSRKWNMAEESFLPLSARPDQESTLIPQMTNRRNYYRMLHVQPDAPLDVIKASYRALMMKMRLHPDLGGDHETAVVINTAYAVLSNPTRRQQYDQILRERDPHVLPQAYRSSVGTTRARSTSLGHGAAQSRGAWPTEHGRCVFCDTQIPFVIRADCRCPRCDSPLARATTSKPPQRRNSSEDVRYRGYTEMSRLLSSTPAGHITDKLPD